MLDVFAEHFLDVGVVVGGDFRIDSPMHLRKLVCFLKSNLSACLRVLLVGLDTVGDLKVLFCGEAVVCVFTL